jgi:hypothetical protein
MLDRCRNCTCHRLPIQKHREGDCSSALPSPSKKGVLHPCPDYQPSHAGRRIHGSSSHNLLSRIVGALQTELAVPRALPLTLRRAGPPTAGQSRASDYSTSVSSSVRIWSTRSSWSMPFHCSISSSSAANCSMRCTFVGANQATSRTASHRLKATL